MLTLLFIILMIGVFGRLLMLSARAAWGITKILFHLALLPIVLIVMVVCGLIYIALPVLALIGLVTLLGGKRL